MRRDGTNGSTKAMARARGLRRCVLLLTVIATGACTGGEPARPALDAKTTPTETSMDKDTAAAKSDVAAPQAGEVAATTLPQSEDEWREKLSPEQYYVCRMGGTERPFTGKYWNSKEEGVYHCAGCEAALFSSGTKFDSGSGWPSYFAPVSEEAVESKVDRSHGMVRTEVLCRRCQSHLGHIFPDGPPPTGLRYCINSASLTFVATAPPPSKP